VTLEEIYPCNCGATDAMPALDHRADGLGYARVECSECEAEGPDHRADGLWYARVECSECEAEGPERQSTDADVAERRAIESWNELRFQKEGVGDDAA